MSPNESFTVSPPTSLQEFAETLLFGTRLEDKLFQPEGLSDTENSRKMLHLVPKFPGRPIYLSKVGRAEFPKDHHLEKDLERAKVLHFFANHELLALELMALMLLRFPEAPTNFRKGVASIMRQEQDHLKLYIHRMNQLGLELGALPVNDYFWNTLKNMKSPLDFTLQMSLTFEQANLDFSFYYRNLVQNIGDQETAAVLNRVFIEEIAHVKHGVHWYHQWKDPRESDWEYYLKNLPPPLTPQRAKGVFFCVDPRKQAGLSDDFIRELKVYSGSKGRPPSVWYYDPHCDAQILREKAGYTPPQGAKQVSQDLETVLLFLCKTQDVLLLSQKPRAEFLENLQEFGFKIPEIAVFTADSSTSGKGLTPEAIQKAVTHKKIGGIHPWGWSPVVYELFKPFASQLAEVAGGNSGYCKKIFELNSFADTGLGKFFSKTWSASFLKDYQWPSPSESSSLIVSDFESARKGIESILSKGQPVMLKAPYGTSGMQNKKLLSLDELTSPIAGQITPKEGWIKNTLAEQGSLIIEHYLEKLTDLSIQLEIRADRVEIFPVRAFITGSQNEYRGAYLGPVGNYVSEGEAKLIHQTLPKWLKFIRALGQRLQSEGYEGPAGIDAFTYRALDGSIALKPLVELNPRFTMGRVALALEKHLLPGIYGVWKFVSRPEIQKEGFKDFASYVKEHKTKTPPVFRKSGSKLVLASGFIPTQDPQLAQRVLPILEALPNHASPGKPVD